jgi:hypothetical protein
MQPLLVASSALSTCIGAIMIGVVSFLPLYAQGVLGATPMQAGASIAPMVISWPIASTLSARLISPLGFRMLIRAGMLAVTIAAVAMVISLYGGASESKLRFFSGLFGFGMGFATTPLIIAVQTAVRFEERGVATASTVFFRSIGSTVGAGIMGAILARALLANPAVHSEGGGRLVERILGPDRRSISGEVLTSLSSDLQHGICSIFWLCILLSAFGLASAWLFPLVEVKPQMRAS